MARRWLVAAAVGAGLLTLAACDLTGKETATDDSSVESQFTAVRIANDSGRVKIHSGSPAKVHRTMHFDKTKPGSTFHVDGTVLVIESCKERNCSIDYDVTVPAGTKVDGAINSGSVELDGVAGVNLKSDSGRVTMRHISGKVNLDSSSGSIEVSDVSDAVTIRSESGRVAVNDVRGAVSVEADSGSVEATGVGGPVAVHASSGSVTAGLSSAQDVKVKADSGSVTVTVPRAAYRLLTNTDSGRVSGDVHDDATGTHRLDLQTDSGSITVRYS